MASKSATKHSRHTPKNKEFLGAKGGFEATYMMVSELAKKQMTSRVDRFTVTEAGSFKLQPYPWIPKDMIERSDEVTAACNKLLEKRSGTPERFSKIGGYGMFAKNANQRGDVLLWIKRTALIGASPLPRQAKLLPFSAAHRYHNVHGKDYSRLYKDAQKAEGLDCSPKFTKLVYLRMLAICVQGGVHPLKSTLFAGLIPPSGADFEPVVS
ncbi:uncharacterized protein PAC_15959 [Phialocephala subalpina]|uniref:Uncharacterized protein n=1 Tax=Phialocephala subalpina TaxID=576137 RepID=A0A1L7XM19_9HELO|nr:uncharacterized protein PAC_15959 [Phialocephala subalpina]